MLVTSEGHSTASEHGEARAGPAGFRLQASGFSDRARLPSCGVYTPFRFRPNHPACHGPTLTETRKEITEVC